MKYPKNIHSCEFTSADKKYTIQTKLISHTFKKVLELWVNGCFICLEDISFSFGFFIKSFEHNGEQFTLVISNDPIFEDTPIMCYCDRQALGDSPPIEDLKIIIYDPINALSKREAQKQKTESTIGYMIGYLIVAVLLLLFHREDVWWKNLLYLGTMLFILIAHRALLYLLERKGRRNLAEQLSADDQSENQS